MASVNKSKKSSGRPILSDLQKARKSVVKAYHAWEKVQQEFNLVLGIEPGFQTAEEQEIIDISNQRLVISENIDNKLEEIKDAKLNDADSETLSQLIEDRTLLYSVRNELPDLGYTYKMWESIDNEDKKKRLGKPKLSLEQRYNRAKYSFETQMKDLHEMEGKENKPLSSIEELTSEIKDVKITRLNGGPLAIYDIELARLNRRIEHITSGKEGEEQDAKMAKRKDPTKGRPFEDLDEKLERLYQEKSNMQAHMDAIYDGLSDQEKSIRDLKLQRRKVNEIKNQCKELNLEVSNINDRDYDNPLIQQLVQEEMNLRDVQQVMIAARSFNPESEEAVTTPIGVKAVVRKTKSPESELSEQKAKNEFKELSDMLSEDMISLTQDTEKVINR